MLSPAGTPHVIVGKPVDASGLPSTILQVSQETQEVPGTEPQEHVPPQPKRQRPSIASTEETPSDKKKVSRTSDAGIAVNLTGSQDVFPSPGVRGASMKTELSWYHSEWVPVDEQLGHKVTMDLIPILKQRNAKMKCKHCKGERSFNPTTRYKDHLLSSCKEFAQTETFQSELVQRHLQEMKSKLAKKAKVCAFSHDGTSPVILFQGLHGCM